MPIRHLGIKKWTLNSNSLRKEMNTIIKQKRIEDKHQLNPIMKTKFMKILTTTQIAIVIVIVIVILIVAYDFLIIKQQWHNKSTSELMGNQEIHQKCKNPQIEIKEKRKGTNFSMALSHTGSDLARPLTSFLVLVRRFPFMYDIVSWELIKSPPQQTLMPADCNGYLGKEEVLVLCLFASTSKLGRIDFVSVGPNTNFPNNLM